MKLEVKLPIQNYLYESNRKPSITELKALITFVSEMQENNLWDKMTAMYPFGLTQTAIYQLKNIEINYTIGDNVCSKINGKLLGKCTGFTQDDTCVVIDGYVFGGKSYFEKYNN